VLAHARNHPLRVFEEPARLRGVGIRAFTSCVVDPDPRSFGGFLPPELRMWRCLPNRVQKSDALAPPHTGLGRSEGAALHASGLGNQTSAFPTILELSIGVARMPQWLIVNHLWL
jgi:hypothetical protein